MFFRFVSALILVVLISMCGVALEKESLALRRVVSRQYRQTDELLEQHGRMRLRIQQLTAPGYLATLGEQEAVVRESGSASSAERFDDRARHTAAPLLRWQRGGPGGLDE